MTDLRVIEPCSTTWKSHRGSRWHRCIDGDGLHETAHVCACGEELEVIILRAWGGERIRR